MLDILLFKSNFLYLITLLSEKWTLGQCCTILMWHCPSHCLGELLTPHAAFAQSPSKALSSNHDLPGLHLIWPPCTSLTSLPQFSPLVSALQPCWYDFSWNMPGTVRPQHFSLCLEFSPDNLIISSSPPPKVAFLEQSSNFTSFYQTLVLLLVTQRPILMRAKVGRQENCFETEWWQSREMVTQCPPKTTPEDLSQPWKI